MRLQPVVKSVVSMLSYSITCVFLYLVIILSQYYYFPNSFCLVSAEILHNNTQVHLNYVIKICWTAAGYPVTLIKGQFIPATTQSFSVNSEPIPATPQSFTVSISHHISAGVCATQCIMCSVHGNATKFHPTLQ